LLLLAANHLDWPKTDNLDALHTRARHEIARLERGLVVLEIIVGIAPLLGLVGTIFGMMTLFGNIGQEGLGDANKLASGIAVILVTTLWGLIIAIPSLIFWSLELLQQKGRDNRGGNGNPLRRIHPPSISGGSCQGGMSFYVRKRKQPPAIIIVALVDVLIVLLIFLMATTVFKQQPALKLALPESSQAEKSGAQENPPLVVAIDSSGTLRLGADGRPVTVDRLREELDNAVKTNAQLRLAISADKAAPFGQIVKVMDAAKAAGIKGVNAFTKQAGKG
jgi:biopolymer transport protein ExbD